MAPLIEHLRNANGAKNWRRKSAFVVAAALMVTAACGADSEDAGDGSKPFYEGKTINLIVPSNAGGQIDVVGRFLAEFLQKNLDGNPSIVVENIPEGNQIAGANEFALRREPDGTNLMISGNGLNLAQMLDLEGKQFDFSEWDPLISFPGGNLVMAHADSGVSETAELGDSDVSLIYGGLNPATTDLPQVIAFNLLELDYEPVFGYENNTAIGVALEQGEVTMRADSPTQYFKEMQTLVDQDLVHPMFSLGLMGADGEVGRDPLLPEVPTLEEAYELIHGSEMPDSLGRDAFRMIVGSRVMANVLWLDKEAPEAAQEALTEALQTSMEQPDFEERVETIFGGAQPMMGADIQTPLQAVVEPDGAVIEWIGSFLADEFGV